MLKISENCRRNIFILGMEYRSSAEKMSLGKTTLHAFVKAMLFGLERGRGRAAAKDDFTKYEPRSGGRYAGVMRFDCGGRHFRLERTFGTGGLKILSRRL